MVVNKTNCDDCYWCNQCKGEKICEDYFSIYDDEYGNDSYIEELIENGRKEYREDYFESLDDWSD